MPKSNQNHTLKVCLLSQHELVLSEFQKWLSNSHFNLRPVRIDAGAAAQLRRLEVPRANIYVVDAFAPRPTIEALVAGLLERFPKARVLVMAKDFNEAVAFPLLRLGVKGLVNYALGPQDLPRALLHVSKGGFWVPRSLLSRFVDSILSGASQRIPLRGAGQLSRREQEVLDALLENLSNKEIANNLNISERTAKFHVSNLLEKFGVRRRSDLIMLHFQMRSANS